MSITCDHGRKAFNCRLCRQEEMKAALMTHGDPGDGNLAIPAPPVKWDSTFEVDFAEKERRVLTQVEEYTRFQKETLARDCFQDRRDSDYLLRMMSSRLGRRVEYAEGTAVIDQFLLRRHGPKCKLDGPPQVHGPCVYFPTTYGMRSEYLDKFEAYLFAALRPYVDQVALKKPAPSNITITLKEGALDEVGITGPCEILFNGHKLRAVREGNTLHLITEDYRKLI